MCDFSTFLLQVAYGGTDIGFIASHVVDDWKTFKTHDAGTLFPWAKIKIVDDDNKEVKNNTTNFVFLLTTSRQYL